ncbi:hypothetical protein KXD40_006207 [Peronospora effusa]|nr:hypothetical protein KXD40_006207 [Peronospora effusa]
MDHAFTFLPILEHATAIWRQFLRKQQWTRIGSGKEKANRQLRTHYDNWVTEKDIAALAAIGINPSRIPVSDWMLVLMNLSLAARRVPSMRSTLAGLCLSSGTFIANTQPWKEPHLSIGLFVQLNGVNYDYSSINYSNIYHLILVVEAIDNSLFEKLANIPWEFFYT